MVQCTSTETWLDNMAQVLDCVLFSFLDLEPIYVAPSLLPSFFFSFFFLFVISFVDLLYYNHY